MKCPKCQTYNVYEAEFCKECGQPLQIEVICSPCQYHKDLDNKFCVKCGQPLISIQIPTSVSTQQMPEPTSFGGGRYQVKHHGLIKKGLGKIKNKFGGPENIDPVWNAEFIEIEDAEEIARVRRDAYEKVSYLLDQLEISEYKGE